LNSKLSDICFFVKDKIKLDENQYEGKITLNNYISTENLLPNKRGKTTAAKLPETSSINKFSKNDILVSNIRPYFKKIWFANIEGGCSTDTLIFRAEKNIDPSFLYYILSSDDFFNYATLTSKGTKMPRGDKTAIMNFEVPDFSLEDQTKIGKILSKFDKKLETNNQINKNLEEQGKNIFNEWFFKFKFPNENGQPYKSNGGEMVDSEMGEIPTGWEVKKLKDLGRIVCGKTPPKSKQEYFDGELPFIKIPDMHGQTFVVDTEDSLTDEGRYFQENKTLPPNSVCVSCIATVGLVCINPKNAQTNQQINSIVPNNDNLTPYLYFKMSSMKDFIEILASGGSATLNLNTNNFSNIEIVIPNVYLLQKYHEIVQPLFYKILNNLLENQHLSQIRDSLLPKLMSGEIDVSEVKI